MLPTRRDLLGGALALPAFGAGEPAPGFRLVDITAAAGLGGWRHDHRAAGKKYLPETLGPGCAFLDFDNDGWQDIVFPAPLTLFRNQRDGTFRNVTREAGLAVPPDFIGLGLAVGDFDNDGFADLFVAGVGQNRLFRNNGRGGFADVTRSAGLAPRTGFSTSAMWIDFDRDGLLDLFVCNYVKWSPETDITCSIDGRQKSYCTPEAYRGTTCWLFRNLGNGKFEDVTAKSGIFDASSKSLGVTLVDFDNDGWPDIFVANDTQPNKLYRNLRNGKFEEVGVRTGVAFSDDGKARAGMGVDAADLDNSGVPALAVTNFQNEMVALYKGTGRGFSDVAPGSELGRVSRRSLGFGCFFFDPDLDGLLDLLVVNGHIDNTMRGADYAQAPHLFLNRNGRFEDVAAQVGPDFAKPRVGRGAAFADIDNDGDVDVLTTSNGGPVALYRNDVTGGNRSLRLQLRGTKSNRDGIGAVVRIEFGGGRKSSRTVKSGGSYLSQSELPVTFGLGRAAQADRVVISWPSGRIDEHRNVKAGAYLCEEASFLREQRPHSQTRQGTVRI